MTRAPYTTRDPKFEEVPCRNCQAGHHTDCLKGTEGRTHEGRPLLFICGCTRCPK